MHGTPVHSSVVADVLFILAASRESRVLLEWAIALRAMATGKLGMPPGTQQTELGRRIAQNFLDPQWNVAVRAALGNTQIEYLAHHFYKCCVTNVPTNSRYPIADENWLVGARALYWREPSLQMLANALLDQLRVVTENAVAAIARPSAQPVAVAPLAPTPPRKEMWTKLIARLRLIARAKRFVEQFARDWEAQKARVAAAKATQEAVPLPVATSTAIHAAEAIPTPAPAVMSTPAHTPTHFECVFVPPPACNHVSAPIVNRGPIAVTSAPTQRLVSSTSPCGQAADVNQNASMELFLNSQRAFRGRLLVNRRPLILLAQPP